MDGMITCSMYVRDLSLGVNGRVWDAIGEEEGVDMLLELRGRDFNQVLVISRYVVESSNEFLEPKSASLQSI